MAKIVLSGIHVAYDVEGEGEPVLLIHGLGGTRAQWRAQARALAPHHRVVSYDLRGHGESGLTGAGCPLPELAGDAAELIRALRLGPTHVIGISLGGMIAFQLAVDAPELVRSLTIVNSTPDMRPPRLGDRARLRLRLLMTWLLGPAALGRMLARKLFPKPSQEALREEFTDDMARNDYGAYFRTTRAILSWRGVRQRLREIRCPVLVVSGDRDYTSPAMKQAWITALPDARLVVIADSGHATPLDRPDELNACLREFLDPPRAEPRAAS